MNDYEYYDQQAKRYFHNGDYKGARARLGIATSHGEAMGRAKK